MTQLYVMFKQFLNDQRGVSAVEYAVLAAIILVAVAGALAVFGSDISGWFTDASSAVNSAI